MENKLSPKNRRETSANDIKNDQKVKNEDELALGKEIPETKNVSLAESGHSIDGNVSDDLDDLDDMLDEFGLVNPASTVSSGPQTHTEAITDDDFEKQLEAGMAELFGDLDKSTDIAVKFEDILKELGEAAAQGKGSRAQPYVSTSKESKAKIGTKSTTNEVEASFQDTIKKTMERMETSGDQATSAAAALDNNGDVLAEMLKAMQGLDLDGEVGEEENFSKALLGMMEQLTNKEILYEPMKELDDKYPAWIEKHAQEINKADLARYKEQQMFVSEIVKRFESEKYDDDSAADKEYIVERMQKMQAAGSPPSDLVGDFAAAQEIFGAPEEGCSMQ